MIVLFTSDTYYPSPNQRPRSGSKFLINCWLITNTKVKSAIEQRKPLVTTPGPRSLIFRGAITGVIPAKKGCNSMSDPCSADCGGHANGDGHRTMDTHLYFEGELIDAATNKPVVKVVRQGEVKT
ncbi:DUF3313 family protein [Salmonella enterica]|uniref:DUF3313 family protein n=1 Tax=Salmonella enterica TaxID=28901 RepID=UPI0010BF5861|nr:DUF3313 family protein [Salmonella enterica]QCJ26393.1 DUF3313 domain-containing protein [Salmonella enterica subsp. enterica serovar Typhimurium]